MAHVSLRRVDRAVSELHLRAERKPGTCVRDLPKTRWCRHVFPYREKGKRPKKLSQDIGMFFLSFNSSYATNAIHTCTINEQVTNNIFILEFLVNVTLNN